MLKIRVSEVFDMPLLQDWIKKRPVAPPNRHIKPLRIRFTPDLTHFRNPSIIAAQLRVLAVNTDGVPATLGAFDSELLERGMRFRFTSDLTLHEFKGRVYNYLSSTVTRRLTFSI